MIRLRPATTPTRSFLLLLALSCALVGGGCGSASDSAGSGEEAGEEVPAIDILEVVFTRASIRSTRDDPSGCDLVSHRLRFADRLGGVQTFLSGHSLRLALSIPGLGGPVRVEPGDEICLESVISALVGGGRVTRQCLTIESDTERLDYTMFNGTGACNIRVDAPAVVSRFDVEIFCESSCQGNIDCGRIANGCVESCIDDLTNASPFEDPVCHDTTRAAITCLNRTACVGLSPAEACDGILRSSAFQSPDCPKPLIPLPPLPPNVELDPARCEPNAADLVSGRPGDFATISRTRDDTSSFYLLLDLNQLVEIDAALEENPDDPILKSAAEVVAALREANQTSIDAEPRSAAVR